MHGQRRSRDCTNEREFESFRVRHIHRTLSRAVQKLKI